MIVALAPVEHGDLAVSRMVEGLYLDGSAAPAVLELGHRVVLAEADLALRREGDVLGSAQSGKASRLRFLSVVRDGAIIEEARESAGELIAADPSLASYPELAASLNDASSEELVWMERS